MKIVLGTVQFGMDYGVSNKLGQVKEKQVHDILEFAYKSGITVMDTAALYGESEKVLGRVAPDCDEWNIITKTQSFKEEVIGKSQLDKLKISFSESLSNLRKNQLHGLLVHSCDDLFKPGGFRIFHYLEQLRSSGLVKKIGVSVYNSDQIDKLLDNFDIDIIQLPVNLLDQRLIQSKHLKKLKEYGVEIHARTVFLQGLLLMPLHSLPPYFLPIQEILKKIEDKAQELSISRLELALGFIQSVDEIDKIVVGVNTLEQLHEIINATKIHINKDEFFNLSINDQNYLNPSLWKI